MHEAASNGADLPHGLAAGWADADEALDDTLLWLRVDAGEIEHVRLLTDETLHYWGHWVPAIRAYRRCTSPGCPFCMARTSGRLQTRNLASERRVRYLVPVQRYCGSVAVWEFGDAVARQLQLITGWKRGQGGSVERDLPLLGLAVSLCREGGRPAGAVLVSPALDLVWHDGLPAPLPVGPIMAELWRRAALHDGKAQPKLPLGF